MSDSINRDLNCEIEKIFSNNKQMQKFRNYISRILEDKTHYDFARPYLPDDIINIVVEKLLMGKYHWNKESCSFVTFFWFRIRTISYNIIKHERQFVPVKINESDAGNDDNTDDEPIANSPKYLIPRDFMVFPELDNKQEEKNYIDPLEFTNTAFALFKDSPEEFCVLDEMYKGFKPRQIADHLGLKVTEVYNIRQRIRRTLQNYYFNK